MHGDAGQGRPISEADRIRAATELMNRGLGRFGDKPDRRISSTQEDQELINSGLARYIRERTDGGLEPAYFLLEVASGRDEGFTMHQRVTAARELIRRGCDTNYDRVTPEDIAAYYERQEAREPTGYDNRLQEWREKERAAQEEQQKARENEAPEDEPQLEAGLFAHLSFEEIDRYEAMSAEEQAEFVEKQRQYRATASVIPAQAGIQESHTPDDFAATTHTENAAETNESNQGFANHRQVHPTPGRQRALTNTPACQVPIPDPHPQPLILPILYILSAPSYLTADRWQITSTPGSA